MLGAVTWGHSSLTRQPVSTPENIGFFEALAVSCLSEGIRPGVRFAGRGICFNPGVKAEGNGNGCGSRAVLEPWPDPVNGEELLDSLARELSRFVVLSKWAAETLALWILHTYAFHLRNVSTYIGIESPEKQCGKTTLLTILSRLVNRPEIAAHISPPALFRVIEENQPTLLIDEGDTFLRRNAELRGILNAGYTRETAYVVRVIHEREAEKRQAAQEQPPEWSRDWDPTRRASRLMRFSCFCPKAMASIGGLPETLADRCIRIHMRRKTAAEECERCRNLDPTDLRRQCARFVEDHSDAIASARPAIPSGLPDRAADIWEPLLALADLAGGRWPVLAREAMTGLTAKAKESNPMASLILDILHVFVEAKSDRIFSRTLAAGLDRLTGRPWTLMKGKQKTEAWLARQLRPLGPQPRSMWMGGVSARGYLLQDFAEVFRRYLTASELQALGAVI